MEDKIDIHKTDQRYEALIEKLVSDDCMNGKNRDLILKFVWDCKIGKTVRGRAKKKIGKKRIMKYVYILRTVSGWLGKPFDEVSNEEMERFVSDVEENVYKKKTGNSEELSEQTKLDYKKTLKKFYKWLGKPDLVEFMDMSAKVRDVPALSREEIEIMVNSTSDKSTKAALMVLFDGGARSEEFLNLRIKDLSKKKYGDDNDCYWINIRYSKTYPRNIPLPLCGKYLADWMSTHPGKEKQDSPLFPCKYIGLRKRVMNLGKKVLKKHVTLHTLRHSSATYWAPKMNRYQLCAKYGWAFSSDMPDRYIQRKGIIFDEIAEKGDTDQMAKVQKQNRQLMEKMEVLEMEYNKVRKALEFIMPVIEEMDGDLKRRIFEKRKKEIIIGVDFLDNRQAM